MFNCSSKKIDNIQQQEKNHHKHHSWKKNHPKNAKDYHHFQLYAHQDAIDSTESSDKDASNNYNNIKPEAIVNRKKFQSQSQFNDDSLIVKTKNGYVKGIRQKTVTGRTVDAFLGIRYAKAPIGEYRFRHPKPVDPWHGVFQATSYSPGCIQGSDSFFGEFRGSTMWNANVPLDEDCLSLNIWVPRPRPHNSAVLLWIFGGGFATGVSSLDIYNGSILAGEENIIVVSINYRLAALGFLYLGQDLPGNAGIYDQIMAMEWVRDNIAFFGGNSANITLFGESAGAASAAFHLLSPISRNFFSQAILQSGSATSPWAILDREVAFMRSLKLARNVGCELSSSLLSFIQSSSSSALVSKSLVDNLILHNNNFDKVIQCLQKVAPMELINREETLDGVVEFAFVPIVDGYFLNEDPLISLREKNFKQTNIMVGSNKDEGTYWLVYNQPHLFNLTENVYVSKVEFDSSVHKMYQDKPIIAQEAIIFEYTNWLNPEDPVKNREAVDRIVGDYHFTCHVNEIAYRYAYYGNNVYSYHFVHRPSSSPWPNWMGSIHGDEILFVFGDPLFPEHKYSDEEKKLSRNMMRYWANFARTG